MKISKSFVKRKFKEYNVLYFKWKLRMPTFEMVETNKFAMHFMCGNDPINPSVRKNTIQINTRVRWKEDRVQEALIHEMIHYYINARHYSQSNLRKSILFWLIRWWLNLKYGLHIHHECQFVLRTGIDDCIDIVKHNGFSGVDEEWQVGQSVCRINQEHRIKRGEDGKEEREPYLLETKLTYLGEERKNGKITYTFQVYYNGRRDHKVEQSFPDKTLEEN